MPVCQVRQVIVPIFSLADAKALSAEAVKQSKTVPFHFALDTGMSRIGFQVTEESADECKAISYGGTYTIDKATRVTTIPVGYADGYPRCLSNLGRVPRVYYKGGKEQFSANYLY